MRGIKKRFLGFLIGAVAGAGEAVVFALLAIWPAAVLLAVAAVALAILALRASRNYQSALLICENPLLNVDTAKVAGADGEPSESVVNAVVSGFGVLMDGKPYKFGHDGIQLTAAAIDRESLAFSFGDENKKYDVRLLHGVDDRQEIETLRERLRYETGVIATVSGW